ncbi:AbfB domain-containing protein [Catenuloplanes japonicus]|uniref:AbfB domain-containing protein n=1 Tax=Catenuloplanes japonicus TaxID=33876 RepID=UPI00068A1431|nr:AbfB domain-containing protein [Catenuloplanes japonicus]
MDPYGGGTVYGKGGAEARPPKRRFGAVHPGVTAGVAFGMVAAFALGWFIWQTTSEPSTLRDLNDAADAGAPPASAGAVSPTPSEGPVELGVGAFKLESVKSPGSIMSKVDGLAVITATGGGLQVVQGLADPACFSFHTEDDTYMRHSGYRLRFDANDDSDLFKKDATFCPEDGVEPGTVTLRSVNYPDHVVHHRNVELWIDESDDSDEFARASSFTVAKG